MRTKLNLKITPIACLTDNYAYIIYDNISKSVAVIDPSESAPIISFLKKKKVKIKLYIKYTSSFWSYWGEYWIKKNI